MPEQRRHHSNGIWLCQTDGKLVDSDAGHFTVTMLREWKAQAEQSSFRAILSARPARSTRVRSPQAIALSSHFCNGYAVRPAQI
jgi:hypothetical protein